jgi:hypothetical protein
MKHSAKNLLAVTLTALGLAALSAQAQGKVNDLNVITISLTLQVQGSFSDNGTTRIYNQPVSRKVNTKDLLSQLARDKFAQGTNSANTFPTGAKLGLSGGNFVVVDHNNQLVVDVSDILQFTRGTNGVLNGRINDTTGLANNQLSETTFVTLTFDDTFITGGGGLNFILAGVDTLKIKDRTLTGKNYQEITSDNVKNAGGEGQSAGTPFVVTGSIDGSRNVTLTLP